MTRWPSLAVAQVGCHTTRCTPLHHATKSPADGGDGTVTSVRQAGSPPLREKASAAGRCDHCCVTGPLRRLRPQSGCSQAMVATARKLLPAALLLALPQLLACEVTTSTSGESLRAGKPGGCGSRHDRSDRREPVPCVASPSHCRPDGAVLVQSLPCNGCVCVLCAFGHVNRRLCRRWSAGERHCSVRLLLTRWPCRCTGTTAATS